MRKIPIAGREWSPTYQTKDVWSTRTTFDLHGPAPITGRDTRKPTASLSGGRRRPVPVFWPLFQEKREPDKTADNWAASHARRRSWEWSGKFFFFLGSEKVEVDLSVSKDPVYNIIDIFQVPRERLGLKVLEYLEEEELSGQKDIVQRSGRNQPRDIWTKSDQAQVSPACSPASSPAWSSEAYCVLFGHVLCRSWIWTDGLDSRMTLLQLPWI